VSDNGKLPQVNSAKTQLDALKNARLNGSGEDVQNASKAARAAVQNALPHLSGQAKSQAEAFLASADPRKEMIAASKLSGSIS
jgi:hypothetical protein